MVRPVLDPGLAERIRSTGAGDRRLPLCPELHRWLGESLQRGVTVAVTGSPAGAVAVSLQLAAGPSTSGSWVAAVGLPDLGLVAAAESGIELERLALVPFTEGRRPGVGVGPHAPEAFGTRAGLSRPPGKTTWPEVVAALVDGFDVVLARPPAHLKAGLARRLVARARERGTVLVGVGGWPEGASLRIEVASAGWEGLYLDASKADGAGHLSAVHRHLTPTGRKYLTDGRVFAASSGEAGSGERGERGERSA